MFLILAPPTKRGGDLGLFLFSKYQFQDESILISIWVLLCSEIDHREKILVCLDNSTMFIVCTFLLDVSIVLINLTDVCFVHESYYCLVSTWIITKYEASSLMNV